MHSQAHRWAPSEPASPADALLTPQQTADYTGLAITTLQRQRTEGTGPKFVKLGKRRVAYRLADVQTWLEERVARSTADARSRGLAT
jgi:predicted DNA-binding transcriptional regulator AlpA